MVSSVKRNRFLTCAKEGSAVTYHGQIRQPPVPIAVWLGKWQSSGPDILRCFGNYSLFSCWNMWALASRTVCVLPLASRFEIKINTAGSLSDGLIFASIFSFLQASGMTNFNFLVVLVWPLVFVFCGSLNFLFCFVFKQIDELMGYTSPPFLFSPPPPPPKLSRMWGIHSSRQHIWCASGSSWGSSA